MNRTLPILLLLGAIGLAFSYSDSRAGTGNDVDGNGHITELQRQRVALLAKRVSHVKEYHDAKLIDRTELIASQIDLVNAKLDYANSTIEKRELLSSLLQHYDEQIRLAELATKAPPTLPNAGERRTAHGPAPLSALLLLKSERIRIEIQVEALK